MLSKSDIEYLDFNWAFQTGCKHGLDICPCSDKCWARGMAHRFNRSFEPTLHPEKLLDPLRLKKPARIGVCFTGDLFGEWVDPEMVNLDGDDKIPADVTLKQHIFKVVELCPQHTFVFLTKNPAGLLKWGKFPSNCWVGVTVCDNTFLPNALVGLSYIDVKVKFLSLEPLMGGIFHQDAFVWQLKNYDIGWLVIGGWSAGKVQPKIEWIKEIIEAADKAGVPVFLKNNLDGLLGQDKDYKKWLGTDKDGNNLYGLRQEFPKEVDCG